MKCRRYARYNYLIEFNDCLGPEFPGIVRPHNRVAIYYFGMYIMSITSDAVRYSDGERS